MMVKEKKIGSIQSGGKAEFFEKAARLIKYVNYFGRYIKIKHENPTVGIFLCKEKKGKVK
jgi:hypothetical protein